MTNGVSPCPIKNILGQENKNINRFWNFFYKCFGELSVFLWGILWNYYLMPQDESKIVLDNF